MWFTILLYAVMIYMVFNIIKNSKTQKKRQQLIDCVNSVKEKDVFFEKVEAVINNNTENPSMANKARVIKLWGEAFHSEYDSFQETLDSIDVQALTVTTKRGVSIDRNEDSFFYLYLGIPNILYRDEKMDLLDLLNEKMQGMKDTLSDELVCAISVEITKFYKNEGDRGLAFYEKILNGDYGEFRYSKSMIGLYKSIANATAARIYLDNGETDKYQGTEGLLKDFNLSGVGQRWLKTLHIELPEEKSENEEEAPAEEDKDTETFQITNESAKNADVIDAEIVNEHEENDEEKKEDQK